MKSVIKLDVPEWQIGQNVSVYFPDTMLKHGKCELLKEQEIIVRCKDCVNRHDSINCRMFSEGMDTSDNWFCADGEHS